jgi:hypothetical protein
LALSPTTKAAERQIKPGYFKKKAGAVATLAAFVLLSFCDPQGLRERNYRTNPKERHRLLAKKEQRAASCLVPHPLLPDSTHPSSLHAHTTGPNENDSLLAAAPEAGSESRHRPAASRPTTPTIIIINAAAAATSRLLLVNP